MGPTQINGIPAHPLLVHLVVVLVPLTALALVACAAWPSVMRRFGLALPAVALVALISVPLTTHAGEWLEEQVRETELLEQHAEMGDELLPWAIGLFVVATALWWTYRRSAAAPDAGVDGEHTAAKKPSVALRAAAVVVSIIVAAGAVVQVYRIGDSGAKAVWKAAGSTSSIGDTRGA